MILRDKNHCIMVQERDEAMFADLANSHGEGAEFVKKSAPAASKVEPEIPPPAVDPVRIVTPDSILPSAVPSPARLKARVSGAAGQNKSGAIKKDAVLAAEAESTPVTESSAWVHAVSKSHEAIAGLVLWEDRAVVSILGHRKGSTFLRQAGQLVFSKNATDAERSKMLKKWWKSSRFCTRSVWAGFYTSADIQKYFSLPVAEDGLRAALTLEAEESLQVESPNALMDFFVFEKKKPDDPFTGMMFASPRWSILRFKKILDDAGLLVCGVGAPSAELARTFRWLGPTVSPQFADCVVVLTETSANIVIIYGNSSFYSRMIESASGGWADSMEYLVQSLNDAFMYFQLYLANIPVGRIQLTGHFTENVDMTGFLLRETGLVVRQWDPLSEGGRLYCSPKLMSSSPDLLVSSLGLALRRD